MNRESRRSTRVPLRVVIKAQGIAEPLTCEGETIIVNIHGALISTSVVLSVGMKIEIHVYLTGKHANAEVVYVDPQQPMRCGNGLAKVTAAKRTAREVVNAEMLWIEEPLSIPLQAQLSIDATACGMPMPRRLDNLSRRETPRHNQSSRAREQCGLGR